MEDMQGSNFRHFSILGTFRGSRINTKVGALIVQTIERLFHTTRYRFAY